MQKLLVKPIHIAILGIAVIVIHLSLGPGKGQPVVKQVMPRPSSPEQDALRMIKEGRQTFRHDTFGDESFWGDALKLHQAIAGEKLGGVGPGVSPKTALAVGLRVDMDALPGDLVQKVKLQQVNLDDPATTVALLKLDAVVGVRGFLDDRGQVKSIGITCAICHSTVDDAFAPWYWAPARRLAQSRFERGQDHHPGAEPQALYRSARHQRKRLEKGAAGMGTRQI